MTISLFAYFEAPDAAKVSTKDLAYAMDVLGKLPRRAKALVYTPPETSADHYFMNDPAPPAFAFQIYFAAIEHLEDVLRRLGSASGRGSRIRRWSAARIR